MTYVFVHFPSDMSKEIKIIGDYTTDAKVGRFAADIARESVEKWGNSLDTATYIKDKLKEAFSGEWCCIVGTDYSSSVIYCEKNYINVKIGEVEVLMFQSGKACRC